MSSDRRSGGATSTRVVHVDDVNDWGVKVGSEWLNYSKWAKSVDPVTAGMDVEIEQDNGGYIRRLVVLDAPQREVLRDHAGPSKDVQIVRQTCIKVAATYAASRPEMKCGDLIKLAEALEGWVLR